MYFQTLLFENFILSVSNIRIIKQPNEVKAIVQLEVNNLLLFLFN
jgi:hypothetical protein